MFEPCSVNMPKIEKHDRLGKASLEHDNNKKNSIYEHCNAPKVGKFYFSEPFMCFSGQSLSRLEVIYFLGKRIPRKWGSVFSRHRETSSRGILPITKYDSWKSVILGNCLHGELSPQYAPLGIPPLVFSRGDLTLCLTESSCSRM